MYLADYLRVDWNPSDRNLQTRLAYWIGCLENPKTWLCPKITAMLTVIYHNQQHSDIDLWSLKMKC